MKALPALPFRLRPALPSDEPLLWEMLYQAIYVPPGAAAPPRAILRQPQFSRYVQDWDRPGDLGLIAQAIPADQPVGAAWLRLLVGEQRGYGYVDETTPELSIAVLPPYRGGGIGSALLSALLELATPRHRAVSLSVSASNPARRLYERFGFETVADSVESLTMLKRLVAA
jgi:ribosomal protein S18 acetylase RimI-like enzyme